MKTRPRLDLPVGEMTMLYGFGWSSRRLAARYRIGVATVLARLHENGVQLRPRGGQRKNAQATP